MGRWSGRSCRLSTMFLMTSSFFLVEIIVGYMTNSIALVADSFHMLSDVVALIVGFASVKISKWPSKRNTYGWVRAEVLGALVNAVFLFALCFSILVESFKRLVETEAVENPKLLIIVGSIGLLINLVGLFLFGGHGHSHGGGHGHSHGGGGHGHSHGGGGHGHSHGGGGHGHSHGGGGHGHSHDKGGLSHNNEEEENRHCVDVEGGDCHQNTKANCPSTEIDVLVEPQTSADSSSSTDDREVYTGPNSSITIEVKKPKPAASLNMRGVFLHVLGDALGSVVVIVSALIIWFAEGKWTMYVDPGMSILMVIIILTTTIPLLKESAYVLLQTVPSHLDVEKIIKELEKMEGIIGVHECHIWQLAGNRIIASAHVRCHDVDEYMTLAAKIKMVFHQAGIHSTTIQPEFLMASDDSRECALLCHTEGDKCIQDTCCGQRQGQATPSKAIKNGGKNNYNANANTIAQPLMLPGSSDNVGKIGINWSPEGDEVVLEMNDIKAQVS